MNQDHINTINSVLSDQLNSLRNTKQWLEEGGFIPSTDLLSKISEVQEAKDALKTAIDNHMIHLM